MAGKTNNDRLKQILELKGRPSGRFVRKGNLWRKHFDDGLNFKLRGTDHVNGQTVACIITDFSPKKRVKDFIMERVGVDRCQSSKLEDQHYVGQALKFADLLEQMLVMDPEVMMVIAVFLQMSTLWVVTRILTTKTTVLIIGAFICQ